MEAPVPLSPDQPRTSSDISQEREDWQELVTSAGWRRFVQIVHDRYQGAGYANAMRNALLAGTPQDAIVFQRVADEALKLVTIPVARFRELNGEAQ